MCNYTTHPKWPTQFKVPSDHIPLTFSYKFEIDHFVHKPLKHKTWNLNSNRYEQYLNKTQQHFDNFHFPKPNNIQDCYNRLLTTWHNITTNTIGKKYIKPKKTPWWTNKVDKLHTKVKQLSRKFYNFAYKHPNEPNPFASDLKFYTIQKNETMKKAKKNHIKITNLMFSDSPHTANTYQKAINKYQDHKRNTISELPTLIDEQDQKIEDPKQKVQLLHDAMTNPPKIDPTTLSPDHKTHHAHILNWYTNFKRSISATPQTLHKFDTANINHFKNTSRFKYKNINDPNELTPLMNLLNKPITIVEFQHTLASLDNHKAMGDDKTHNKLIKTAHPNLHKKIIQLFNLSLRTGEQPKQWRIDTIIPIPKPKRDHSIPKNYRPIAISSCLGRLLQKIIASRLQAFCLTLGIFKHNQSGFQINRSTLNAFLPLYHNILLSNKYSSNTYILKTDFDKAYDSIWHAGLLYKLKHNYKLDGPILKWLHNFITQRSTYVQCGTIKSKLKLQDIGVPQGSSLSPILYILYTNDFALSPTGIKYLSQSGFADDNIFYNKPFFPFKNHHQIIPKILYHEFTNFKNWCLKWRLNLNQSKNEWYNIHSNNKHHQSIFNYDPPALSNNNTVPNLSSAQPHVIIQNDYIDSTQHKILNQYQLTDHLTLSKNGCSLPSQVLQYDTNYNNILPTHAQTPLPKSDKILNNFKYLGFRYSNAHNFLPHNKHVTNNMWYHLNRFNTFEVIGLRFKLSTLTNIYYCKARSKIEYGMGATLDKHAIDACQKIQNKYLKFMLKTNFNTSIKDIHFILNTPFIQDRINFFLARQFIQCYYALPYHPNYHIMTTFLNAITHNVPPREQSLCSLIYNDTHHGPTHKYLTKHPLYKGLSYLYELSHPIINLKRDKITPQPYTALPIHELPLPPFIVFDPEIHTTNIPWNPSEPTFYGDASSIIWRRKSGYGFIRATMFKSRDLIYKTTVIQYVKDPTVLEFQTFLSILEYIDTNDEFMHAPLTFHICSDSQTSLNTLQRVNHPKSYQLYQLNQQCIHNLYCLYNKKYIKKIVFHKIKSKSKCYYHNTIHKLVRDALKDDENIHDCWADDNHNMTYDDHLYFLKTYHNKKIRQQWRDHTYQEHTMRHYLHEVFDEPNKRLKQLLNHFTEPKHIFILVNCFNNTIYTKQYKFLFPRAFNTQVTDTYCDLCNLYFCQTLSHIFFKCTKFSTIRKDWYTKLYAIDPVYRKCLHPAPGEEINDDPEILHVLFPFKTINTTDNVEEYNHKTIQVWQSLIQYCLKTELDIFIYHKYTKKKVYD